MNDEIYSWVSVKNANAWWSALPDCTKVAIYEDLMDILEHERIAG